MKMNEMYSEIINKMNEYEPMLKKQEEIVAECEKATEKAMVAQETAENKLNNIKSKYDALIKMKDAYESAFGLNSEDITETAEVKEVEKTEKAETKVNEQKSKKEGLVWKHKTARLIRFDRSGTKIGDYASQAAASRQLGWDQSSLSRFMKFSEAEQIRKKNFYFKWEY